MVQCEAVEENAQTPKQKYTFACCARMRYPAALGTVKRRPDEKKEKTIPWSCQRLQRSDPPFCNADDLSLRCVMCFTMPRLESSLVVVSGINGDGTFQRVNHRHCEECAKKRRLRSRSCGTGGSHLLTRSACASSCHARCHRQTTARCRCREFRRRPGTRPCRGSTALPSRPDEAGRRQTCPQQP